MAGVEADHPFKLIDTPQKQLNKKRSELTVSEQKATEMTLIHNMYLLGLNSIYLQAPNVTKEQDVKDLSGFIMAWCDGISGHHDTEEVVLFPGIEEAAGKPGLMSANVEQHKIFHDGMDQLQDYARDVVAGKAQYDGQKVIQLIDGFGPALNQHLADEIPTLLGLEGYKIDWKTLKSEAEKHALSCGDKYLSLPYFLTGWDKNMEGGIHGPLPLPWFIKLYIAWGPMRKYPGYWRFSACDTSGNRRKLPFAKPAAPVATT